MTEKLRSPVAPVSCWDTRLALLSLSNRSGCSAPSYCSQYWRWWRSRGETTQRRNSRAVYNTVCSPHPDTTSRRLLNDTEELSASTPPDDAEGDAMLQGSTRRPLGSRRPCCSSVESRVQVLEYFRLLLHLGTRNHEITLTKLLKPGAE